MLKYAILILLVFILAACGGSGSKGEVDLSPAPRQPSVSVTPAGPFPFGVGTTWMYKTTSPSGEVGTAARVVTSSGINPVITDTVTTASGTTTQTFNYEIYSNALNLKITVNNPGYPTVTYLVPELPSEFILDYAHFFTGTPYYNYVLKVLDAESIVVQGGTFNAWKISKQDFSTSANNIITYTDVYVGWYVPTVGFVKKNFADGTVQELVSYNIQ